MIVGRYIKFASMKILLVKTIIICCITNLIAQVKPDPNYEVREMGLSIEDIRNICYTAETGGDTYEEDWRVSPMEELIYEIEGIDYSDAINDPVKKEEYRSILRKVWREKYSNCFCKLGPKIYGPPAAIMIYKRKTDFLWDSFGLRDLIDNYRPGIEGINDIIWMDYYNKKKGTLVDYVYYVRDESGNHTAAQNSDFRDHLTGVEERLRSLGGKRMKEMASE